MARNRDPVKPVESESESGEEEDDEGSSEESEPETQTPTPTPTQNKLQSPPSVKPPPPPPSSSEEEGSESGSETESESDGPDSSVKPPAEETQKSSSGARKSRSKPNAPEPVTPTKPAAAKRAAEVTPTMDAKKAKTSTEPETSEKKPNLFQRLWSEDDEIAILEGMIGYESENKSDPISDLNSFHDFIKTRLHIDFSRTQLQDKIRRLKRKYENNKGKEKKGGKDKTFLKSHEQRAYDLSKEIWGNENGGEKVVVKNGKGEKLMQQTAKNSNSNSVYSGASVEEMMLRNGREMYEVGRGVEGEKEWEKLRVEELQLYLKQLEVRAAQTKLVLNAINGGD